MFCPKLYAYCVYVHVLCFQDKNCPKDLYGKSCSIVCVPQNSCLSGHYICSPYDGTKVCLVGWMGANCDHRRIPHNLDNTCPLNLTCKNGGQCFDGRCCCKGGYSGEFCHIDSIGCLSSPCLNSAKCMPEGTLAKSYTCKCSFGFHGEYCEVKSKPISHTTIYTGTAYTRTTFTTFAKETHFMQSNSHKAPLSYFDASNYPVYTSLTSTLPVTVLGVPSLEMAYQSSSFDAQGAKDYSIHKQGIETTKPKTVNSLTEMASSHNNWQNHTVKAYTTLYSTKINELVKTQTEVSSQDSPKTPNLSYYITPSASIPMEYSSYIHDKTVNPASSKDIPLMASSGFFDTSEQSTKGKLATKQTEVLPTTILNVMPLTNTSMQRTTETKSSKTLVTVKQSFDIKDTTRNHTELFYVSKPQSSNVTFISVFPTTDRNSSIVTLVSKINGNTISTRLFSNKLTTLSMYGNSFKQSSAMPYLATQSSISAQKTSNNTMHSVAATSAIVESSTFWNPYATTPTETRSYSIIHGNLKPEHTVTSNNIQEMNASVISKASSYTNRTMENSPLLRTTAQVQSRNSSMDNTTVFNSALSKNPASVSRIHVLLIRKIL